MNLQNGGKIQWTIKYIEEPSDRKQNLMALIFYLLRYFTCFIPILLCHIHCQ